MSKQYKQLVSGKPYFADEKINEMKHEARALTHQYNQTDDTEIDLRNIIIRDLFGNVEDTVTVKPPFYCSHGKHIEVGKAFYCNSNCIFSDLNKIIIGDFVLVGPRVTINTALHPLDPVMRRTGIERALPVVIGNDVWICSDVVINPGVEIGAGSVIGSGSVVTRSIPPGVIAVGNPCKIINNIDPSDFDYWYDAVQHYSENNK